MGNCERCLQIFGQDSIIVVCIPVEANSDRRLVCARSQIAEANSRCSIGYR